MKRIFLVLLFLMISPFSLAGDDPATKPFAGSFSGVANFLFDGYCSDLTGVPFHTVTETVGKMARHGKRTSGKEPLLGRVSFATSHCATKDDMHALYGEAVMTAANGHQILFSYTADTIAPPPLIGQSINMVVTGGTGKFRSASGVFTGYVFIEFLGPGTPDWPLEIVLSGWLVY